MYFIWKNVIPFSRLDNFSFKVSDQPCKFNQMKYYTLTFPNDYDDDDYDDKKWEYKVKQKV